MEQVIREILLAYREQRLYKFVKKNYDELEDLVYEVEDDVKPNQALTDLAYEFFKDKKPKHLAGYPIDWDAKTISVPQHLETCGIFSMLQDESKKLGLSIQFNML